MSSLILGDVLLLVIILLDFIEGKLIQKVKPPMVLGILIVGMLIGSFAIGLVDEEIYSSEIVRFVALIAVGLVG